MKLKKKNSILVYNLNCKISVFNVIIKVRNLCYFFKSFYFISSDRFQLYVRKYKIYFSLNI